MNTESAEKDVDLRPVTKIIASYVGNHTLSPEQLPALYQQFQNRLDNISGVRSASLSQYSPQAGCCWNGKRDL